MLSDEMYALKGSLSRNGISYCYSGGMTEEILLGIGNAIRDHMQAEDVDPKTSKRVFGVFVEQVQNIIRYSTEKIATEADKELMFGILAVGREKDSFFVSCGNMIKAGDVPRLKAALEKIQVMDKEELKNLYKDILRGETPEGSKGAGVGFIDIARRATKGIEFGFTPVDERQTFFTIKALF